MNTPGDERTPCDEGDATPSTHSASTYCSEPRRVQQRRTAGWRKPDNTVSVARPSKWGNPVRVVPVRARGPFCLEREGVGFVAQHTDLASARRSAVDRFRDLLAKQPALVRVTVREIRAELAGKNLMCFCPLDHPCHADVLLEIANGGEHA